MVGLGGDGRPPMLDGRTNVFKEARDRPHGYLQSKNKENMGVSTGVRLTQQGSYTYVERLLTL